MAPVMPCSTRQQQQVQKLSQVQLSTDGCVLVAPAPARLPEL
jgi:hypothetical protein